MSHGTPGRAGHGASAENPYVDQWVSFAMAIWLLYIDVISRVISVVDCNTDEAQALHLWVHKICVS